MASIAQQDISPVLFEDTSVAFASQSDSKLRKTYWLFAMMNQAWLVNLGTFFIKLALELRLPVKNLIRNTIFEQFCGGETITDCEKTISALGQSGIGTILDYSVEGEDSEESFEATTAEVLRTIDKAAVSEHIPFTVFKVTGIGSIDLLEKVQQKAELTPPEREAYERIRSRVNSLCSRAYNQRVRIFIDAEESWVQDVIDQLAYEMMNKYNRQQPIVYNTYQLYRHETLEQLKNAYITAREKGYYVGAKLVRGAYIEKERVRARENECCDPIHKNKAATDNDFNAAIDFCLEHIEHIAICLGTHNEYSTLCCAHKMQKKGIAKNDQRVWFAQLLGMSDNISFNLSKEGYKVAKYVPYGPVRSVMPYLFRRAAENTSVAVQSSRELTIISK